jgi:hypothetical protein
MDICPRMEENEFLVVVNPKAERNRVDSRIALIQVIDIIALISGA